MNRAGHFLCLAMAGVLGAGCSDQARMAGGTGSETTNTIGIAVLDQAGRPAAGARVLVRDPDESGSGTRSSAVTDAEGKTILVSVRPGDWIEVVSGDSAAAMTVDRGQASAEVVLRLSGLSGLDVSGLVPSEQVSLPGLGRTAVVDAEGKARFDRLPSGAAVIRIRGIASPVPLPAGGIGRARVQGKVAMSEWPSDGSLDSLAVRRVLDASGLQDVPVDGAAPVVEGRRRQLVLDSQNLTSLPEAIGTLDFLELLSLSNNRIERLPGSIAGLAKLEELRLVGNPLDGVPEVVRSLDSLWSLKLDSTGIDTLPEWIGDLSRLRILRVGQNRLRALPSSLTRLSRLRVLTVHSNPLVALPQGFHRLDSLQEFWGAHHAMVALPDSFAHLPSLRVLQLDYGALERLPEDLGRMGSLRDLRVSSNPIRSLPISVTSLSLDNLDVWNTPLCDLDPSLEPWLDSLATNDWRAQRKASCP